MNLEEIFRSALKAETREQKIRQLIDISIEGARESLVRHGRHKPTFLAITKKGLIGRCLSFESEERKIGSYGFCRLVATASEAEFAILICESWISESAHVPPSQSPSRKECLTVTLETCGERHFAMFPIERDRKGRFKKLGVPKYIAIRAEEDSGRASEFLPPPELAKQAAANAKHVLMMMGLNADGSPVDPIRN